MNFHDDGSRVIGIMEEGVTNDVQIRPRAIEEWKKE